MVSEFGKLLKDKRLEKGLKQEDLAIAIGKTNQYISNIEKGKNNAPPNDSDIEKLISKLELEEREASLFRMRAAACRNALPKRQIDYIFEHHALMQLIEYGEKNCIDDSKWYIILEKITKEISGVTV